MWGPGGEGERERGKRGGERGTRMAPWTFMEPTRYRLVGLQIHTYKSTCAHTHAHTHTLTHTYTLDCCLTLLMTEIESVSQCCALPSPLMPVLERLDNGHTGGAVAATICALRALPEQWVEVLR